MKTARICPNLICKKPLFFGLEERISPMRRKSPENQAIQPTAAWKKATKSAVILSQFLPMRGESV
jgi:hypothetical protein